MSQLQTLQIAFGENANKPIEVTTSRVGTLVAAIGTRKDNADVTITQDSEGNSLLSGYVTAGPNEQFLESNAYILEKNNVNVVGQIAAEQYHLSMGSVTTLLEGKEAQVYVSNSDGVRVAIQSMVVWIEADFSLCVKNSDMYTDEEIRRQFNTKNWVNLGNGKWRSTLNDISGIIKIAPPTKNYSWSMPVDVKAYPASIDDLPSTTDITREQRCTDPVTITVQAIAVTGATIAANKNTAIQEGDFLSFRVDQLVPNTNTKYEYVKDFDATFTANVGTFDSGVYRVPTDITSFTITANITYMGMLIVAQREFSVVSVICTNQTNPNLMNALREALNLDASVDSFTNVDAAQVTETQATEIFKILDKHNVETFDEFSYFSRIRTLDISSLGNNSPNTKLKHFKFKGTSIFGGCFKAIEYVAEEDMPNLTTVTGGSLFNGNLVISSISLPKLESIETTSGQNQYFLYHATSLSKVELPSLKRMSCTANDYAFYGDTSLTEIEFPMLESISTNSGDELMFQGCANLTNVSMPKLTSIRSGNTIGLFNLLTKLTTVDFSSLETMNSANSNNLFNGCTSLRDVSIENLKSISCTNSTASNNVFYNCSSLPSISLDNLESISCNINSMFRGCVALREISLPSLVALNTSGISNFMRGCSALTSLSTPNLVNWTSAEDYSVYGCTSLVRVNFASLETINTTTTNSIFGGCTALRELSFPKLKTIYSVGTNGLSMFKNCDALTDSAQNRIFPTLEKIEAGINTLFDNCTALTSIEFPALKEYVGSGSDRMFVNCSNLTSVSMPELVTYTSYGSLTFAGNDGTNPTNLNKLASVSLPKLESISSNSLHMFYQSVVSTISLPRLRTITTDSANNMFRYCKATSIDLPMLESVISGSSNQTFSNLSNLTTIILPSLKILKAGGNLDGFAGSTKLREVHMPAIEELSCVTNFLFNSCTALQVIDFGKASENSRPLAISGNKQSMLANVPTANLTAMLEEDVNDNKILSRISSIDGDYFINVTNVAPFAVFNKLTNAHSGASWNFVSKKATFQQSSFNHLYFGANSLTTAIFDVRNIRAISGNLSIHSIQTPFFNFKSLTNPCNLMDNSYTFTFRCLFVPTGSFARFIVATNWNKFYVANDANGKYGYNTIRAAFEASVSANGGALYDGTADQYLANTDNKIFPNDMIYWLGFGKKSFVDSAYDIEPEDYLEEGQEIEDVYPNCPLEDKIAIQKDTVVSGDYTWNSVANENHVLEVFKSKGYTHFDDKMYGWELARKTTIENCFRGDTSLTNADFFKYLLSLTGIGTSLVNCTNLKSFYIPKNFLSFQSGAFNGVPNLERVQIEDLSAYCKMTFVDASASPFYASSKAAVYINGERKTEIEIPEGTSAIAAFSFANNKTVTRFILPESMSSINGGAFQGCSSLTRINVPSSVVSFGNNAFNSCASINRIDITDIAAWCNISFGNTASTPLPQNSNAGLYLNGIEVTSLIIPDSIFTMKAYAFYGAKRITSLTIGRNVSVISQNAFYGLGIQTVEIPESVTYITDFAFGNCANLSSITIRSRNISYLSGSAFSGCATGYRIYVPADCVDKYKAEWSTYASKIFPITE